MPETSGSSCCHGRSFASSRPTNTPTACGLASAMVPLSSASTSTSWIPPSLPPPGHPRPAVPPRRQALDLVRALTEIDFRGFDVVEVSPPYDGPGQPTALLAANVAYTMLGLVARTRI